MQREGGNVSKRKSQGVLSEGGGAGRRSMRSRRRRRRKRERGGGGICVTSRNKSWNEEGKK